MTPPFWVFAVFAAATYCIARGIVDIRQRKYVWGALGIVSAGLLLLSPIETHAVKLDLPVPTSR